MINSFIPLMQSIAHPATFVYSRRIQAMRKVLSSVVFLGLFIVLGLSAMQMMPQSFPSLAQSVMASDTLQARMVPIRTPVVSLPLVESITSPPRLSPTFLNQVLASYGSPARGTGQALYDLGRRYSISSDVALAFFGHESTFGTAGEARASGSLGNLRCLDASYDDLHPSCRDGYAWFPTWEAGFEAYYRLLRNLYVNTWHLTTFAQVIHRYAPASDRNDEAAYVHDLVAFLSAWYQGRVRP